LTKITVNLAAKLQFNVQISGELNRKTFKYIAFLSLFTYLKKYILQEKQMFFKSFKLKEKKLFQKNCSNSDELIKISE